MNLLIGLCVHEVVISAILVKEFHLLFVERDLFHHVDRAKSKFFHGTALQISDLGLHKTAQVSGSFVRSREHRIELSVLLDDHASSEAGCWNHEYYLH